MQDHCGHAPHQKHVAPARRRCGRTLVGAVLACAVALCSADDRLLSRATTLLYPRVAARFEATPGGVEHAVRQAIETTWTRGRMETLARLFGNSIDPQRGKPTNTECIALLAEQLRKAYE